MIEQKLDGINMGNPRKYISDTSNWYFLSQHMYQCKHDHAILRYDVSRDTSLESMHDVIINNNILSRNSSLSPCN